MRRIFIAWRSLAAPGSGPCRVGPYRARAVLAVSLIALGCWLAPSSGGAERSKKPSTGSSPTHAAWGVQWRADLPRALATAKQKPEKLVYVLRVLGDLDGFM